MFRGGYPEVSGCLTGAPVSTAVLISRGVTGAGETVTVHRLSGDLSLSLCPASGFEDYLPSFAGRERVESRVWLSRGTRPAGATGRARSMLREAIGALPAWPWCLFGCSVTHASVATAPAVTTPTDLTPKKEGNHECACHPLPPRVLSLGAVLRRLAAEFPQVTPVRTGTSPSPAVFRSRPRQSLSLSKHRAPGTAADVPRGSLGLARLPTGTV